MAAKQFVGIDNADNETEAFSQCNIFHWIS